MTRQAFVRVLLSLLLLFSQQMATSHVISHWSGSLNVAALAQPAADDEQSTPLAKDQSCNKCLAFSQLGAPLGSTIAAYTAPAPGSQPVAAAPIVANHARILLAFQSRAPPQA
jgi:hypothetical protein